METAQLANGHSACREHPDPGGDERLDWFDRDPRACLITGLGCELLHANQTARNYLARGLIWRDGQERLRLPRHGWNAKGGDLLAVPVRQPARALVLVGPTLWLAVTVRRAGDRLFVTAAQIDLGEDLDLGTILRDLGMSEGEAPILQKLAQAACPKEISRALGLSIHTVRSHLRSIYAKLGVNSAAKAQLRIIQAYYLTS